MILWAVAFGIPILVCNSGEYNVYKIFVGLILSFDSFFEYAML